MSKGTAMQCGETISVEWPAAEMTHTCRHESIAAHLIRMLARKCMFQCMETGTAHALTPGSRRHHGNDVPRHHLFATICTKLKGSLCNKRRWNAARLDLTIGQRIFLQLADEVEAQTTLTLTAHCTWHTPPPSCVVPVA